MFRRITLLTVPLAFGLSIASTSLAADLVTPPLFAGLDTNVTCKLTNITSTPIPAQLKLIGAGGTVLKDSSPTTVAAGDTVTIFVNTPDNNVYCRFVNASKSKVRAVLATFVTSSDGTDQVAIAAQ